MPARPDPRVTERLVIRPPRWSDLDVLAEHRADPEVMRFLGDGSPRGPEIELGYRLGRAHWGRGDASEAARAMLAYGHEALALERVLAVTYPANTASQHVLRKIGMREVGLCRAFYDVETLLFESRPASAR